MVQRLAAELPAAPAPRATPSRRASRARARGWPIVRVVAGELEPLRVDVAHAVTRQRRRPRTGSRTTSTATRPGIQSESYALVLVTAEPVRAVGVLLQLADDDVRRARRRSRSVEARAVDLGVDQSDGRDRDGDEADDPDRERSRRGARSSGRGACRSGSRSRRRRAGRRRTRRRTASRGARAVRRPAARAARSGVSDGANRSRRARWGCRAWSSVRRAAVRSTGPGSSGRGRRSGSGRRRCTRS